MNTAIRSDYRLLFVSHNGTFSQLSEQLTEDGYRIYKCNRLAEAVTLLREVAPEAVIIDSDQQEVESLEFCHLLKSDLTGRPAKAIIISSQVSGSNYELSTFDAGADDFISKPFSPSSIIKRIQVRCGLDSGTIDLRSSEKQKKSIHIDRDSYSVLVNQVNVPFSKKEFELLYLLASQPGKVFTRDEIFEQIWKRKPEANDRTIDVHILRLRKKLGEDFISTQKGVGYRFSL